MSNDKTQMAMISMPTVAFGIEYSRTTPTRNGVIVAMMNSLTVPNAKRLQVSGEPQSMPQPLSVWVGGPISPN